MREDNFEFNDMEKYEENTVRPVPAIYHHPALKFDEHNRLICALPTKMKDDERKRFYYKKLPFEPSIDADTDVQLAEIDMLTCVLLPLTTSEVLEEKFLTILINSYHKRTSSFIIEDQPACVADEDFTQAKSMDETEGGDGHTGFAFTGIGGCGKTTLVKRLLERYPKTIIHDTPEGQYLQIVWIKTEPISNGDIHVFLDSIGKQIDKALMNTNQTYYNLIRSQRTLAEKTQKIIDLFRLFNVGILIIDEIQRFIVTRTRLDSFQTLMSMMNKTKTALMVLGTEEAYHKIFYEYYLARRFGSPYLASIYCADYKYFSGLVSTVMQTNWFRTEQEITPEIIKTMYWVTKGIIERIISIWIDVQKKYVKLDDTSKDEFVLTSKFIIECAIEDERYMSDFAEQTLENDFALYELYKQCKIEAERSVKEDKAAENDDTSIPFVEKKTIPDLMNDKELFKSLAECSDIPRAQRLYERVKANLEEGGDTYRKGLIMETVVHTMKLKSFKNKSDDELVTKSIKTIHSKPDAKINLKALEIRESDSIPKIDFSNL